MPSPVWATGFLARRRISIPEPTVAPVCACWSRSLADWRFGKSGQGRACPAQGYKAKSSGKDRGQHGRLSNGFGPLNFARCYMWATPLFGTPTRCNFRCTKPWVSNFGINTISVGCAFPAQSEKTSHGAGTTSEMSARFGNGKRSRSSFQVFWRTSSYGSHRRGAVRHCRRRYLAWRVESAT